MRLTLACTVASVAVLPSLVLAQDTGAARRWTGTADANGTILFGSTEQRIVGTRTTLARGDSVMRASVSLQAVYGDARSAGAPREIVKRLWLGGISLDHRPFAALSPFVFGTVESSLEKRIGLRHTAGLGVKRTFIRGEDRELSLSGAVLDEHTRPLDPAPGLGNSRLTRWSVRARARQQLGTRFRVDHVTFYQPAVRELSRYVVRTTTELVFQPTAPLRLSLSLLDSYDSEARARGAPSNNDGQLVFGIGTAW